MTSKQRLLVLACSQRKRKDEELLPAIERYNGPAYQITRKYLKTVSSSPPTIFILSAQYGLIAADMPIPYYNRKMTFNRAQELKASTEAQLRKITEHHSFGGMMFCLGKLYQATLNKALVDLQSRTRSEIAIAEGSIGRQGSMLYDWLFQSPPPLEQIRNRDTVVFRGIKINSTKESLIATATTALQTNPPEAIRFESWYVLIGKHKVAPKWLFSLLTGLPVSQFRTADAIRVLSAINIEVKRSIL